MANTIKQKRGTTDPAAGDLVVGELAINTTDGGVFTKTDSGSVVEVGAGGGGGGELQQDSQGNLYAGDSAWQSYTSTTNGHCIAIGETAGQNTTTSNESIFIGRHAGEDVTTGDSNIGIGPDCFNNTVGVTGNYNIAISGFLGGGRKLTSGYSNVFIGSRTGESMTTGFTNVAIGDNAGRLSTTAVQLVAIGNQAGQGANGYRNICIGNRAGNAVTGNDNTLIGPGAQYGSGMTGDNNTLIGANAFASSTSVSNEITLGDANITKLRVPGVSFEVSGGQVSANAYTETVYNLTGTAIDPANGAIQTKTLSANTTFTESLAAGESVLIMIDDGSAYTVTWPTTTWVGGSAPTLATTGYTVVELWKVGSTLYGAHVGDVA